MHLQHAEMPPPYRTAPIEVEMPEHGIVVAESHHGQDFLMDWRRDAFAKVLIILSGRGDLQFADGHTVDLAVPTLVCVPPLRQHRLIDSGRAPLSLYVVCIQSDLRPFEALLDRIMSEVRSFSSRSKYLEMTEMLRRILYEQTVRANGYRELITSLVGEFLVALLRESEEGGRDLGSRERVQNYARNLKRHFFRPDSLDNAAQACGLSRRRFSGLFREVTGMGWNQHVNELRIRHARELLTNSTRSIQAIAFESGFDNLAHFYRTFKMLADMTPSQYRSRRNRRRHDEPK